MTKIAIIVGSTRPHRFGPQPAKWIYEAAQQHQGAEFTLLDIADFDLPLLDEPKLPAYGDYEQPHTKRWAEAIGQADGFIIVTPEYNHGISGALKNALDFLFAEWNYKPVAFVSYGADAGGARAVEHLRGIAGQLHMFDLREQVLVSDYFTHLNEDSEFQPKEKHEKAVQAMLDRIVFWSEKFTPLREELLAKQ